MSALTESACFGQYYIPSRKINTVSKRVNMKKKIRLVFAIWLLFSLNGNAQDHNIQLGWEGGIPLGKLDEMSNWGIGMYLNFEYDYSEKVTFGGSFTPFWFKERGSSDFIKALTFQANARYYILQKYESLYVSIYAGFSHLLSNEHAVGFAISPEYGYFINEQFSVMARYQLITRQGGNLSFLTIGFAYNFIPGFDWSY